MTTIFDLFTREELDQQIADKMVAIKQHPTERLSILNYTQVAQYNHKLWNHVTDYCRGLIFDSDTFEIKARSFKKFWNLGDERHPETLIENLPSSLPCITRKMDGSLGIAYYTRKKHGLGFDCAIATRGSFISDQAKWATNEVQKFNLPYMSELTPVFEIIYPENRIVVDYDYSGLVLLALVYNSDGEEVGRELLEKYASLHGLRVAEQFKGDLSAAHSLDEPNEEGWVASWPRPGTTPLRVKIKYETYCRLHRLFTQTSPWRVWDMLRSNQKTDLDSMPEDFRKWFEEQYNRFEGDFYRIKQAALELYDNFGQIDRDEVGFRKRFAQYAVQHPPYTPLLFAWLDGKDLAPIIWKMIEPRGDERAFLQETE